MAVQMMRFALSFLGGFGALAGGAHAAEVLSASGLATGLSRSTLREPWSLATAPALLGLSVRYDLGGGGTLTPGLGWNAQLAAVDSRTGPVAMGFGAEYGISQPPPVGEELPGWLPEDADATNEVTEWSVTGGLAVGLLERRVAVGGMLWRTWRDATYTREDVTWDGGLSVAGRPAPPVVLSLNARRLSWLFLGDEVEPLELSFGAGVEPNEVLTLGGELSTELEDPAPSWRLGLEGRAAQLKLPLRAGVQRDAELDTWFVSGGLGLWTGRAGLDYGLRVDVGPDGGATDITGTRTWHTLSARFAL